MKPLRFRSNEFFLVSLAAHDSTFMPGRDPEKPTLLRKIALFFTIAPSVALIIFPSFDLGTTHFVKPSFELPNSVKAGEILTLPAKEIDFAEISGRPLLKGLQAQSDPFYYGIVSGANAPRMDLSFAYRNTDQKWHPRKLLPKFKNPTLSVFSKQIKVEAPAPLATNIPETPTRGAHKTNAPQVDPAEAATFNRLDGAAKVDCWAEPEALELEPPAKRRRGQPMRLASLAAASAGEVAYLSPTATAKKSVILYHGGGLFSRYQDLHEVKVRKGEKVAKGQVVGSMGLGWGEAMNPKWDIIWEKSSVNPQSFLTLSSQLCGSK